MAVVTASAQFDPQMGQYMYLPTAYNPAAVGEGGLMKVAGMHRMQFVNITNAPMSTWFSFSSPFVIGKTSHGAGVRFLNDRYGLFTNQAFYALYAYRHKLGKGYLSAGVDLGFVNVGFKGDSINLSKMGDDYHEANDEALPTGSKSDMKFDIGVGLYYSTPTWWVGASYSHLTRPVMDWSDGTDGAKKEMRLVGRIPLPVEKLPGLDADPQRNGDERLHQLGYQPDADVRLQGPIPLGTRLPHRWKCEYIVGN